MIFFSRAAKYRVQLIPSGFEYDESAPNKLRRVPEANGEVAEFRGGMYDTETYLGQMTPGQLIARLKSLPGYGYQRDVWSRDDIPEKVAMEEELRQLRRLKEEYEKMNGPRVVIMDKPSVTENPPENKMVYLAKLRNEAKVSGIKADKSWGIPEFEAALAAIKEE